MCVTWAGQERTVTPRLLAVILWWDPRPQFQVKMINTFTVHFPFSAPFFILHFLSIQYSLLSIVVPLHTSPLLISFSSSFIMPPIPKCYVEYLQLLFCFVFAFFVAFFIYLSFCILVHVCSLKPAALVFTEPCMSFFLFVIIFTLILCRQADVFDGVT